MRGGGNQFKKIKMKTKLSGVQIIALERERHSEVEGWTPEHDDQHSDGELAEAASCYAAYANIRAGGMDARDKGYDLTIGRTYRWPWKRHWWKPTPNDRIRELAKAGALIAAEIDRLQRANGQT